MKELLTLRERGVERVAAELAATTNDLPVLSRLFDYLCPKLWHGTPVQRATAIRECLKDAAARFPSERIAEASRDSSVTKQDAVLILYDAYDFDMATLDEIRRLKLAHGYVKLAEYLCRLTGIPQGRTGPLFRQLSDSLREDLALHLLWLEEDRKGRNMPNPAELPDDTDDSNKPLNADDVPEPEDDAPAEKSAPSGKFSITIGSIGTSVTGDGTRIKQKNYYYGRKEK